MVWAIMKAQLIRTGNVIHTNVVGIIDTEANELSILQLLIGGVPNLADLFNPFDFCHTS